MPSDYAIRALSRGLQALMLWAISLTATGGTAGHLEGLEMDVMVSGERPAEAAHRIALPPPAMAADAPELIELDDQAQRRDHAAPALAPDDLQPALAPLPEPAPPIDGPD